MNASRNSGNRLYRNVSQNPPEYAFRPVWTKKLSLKRLVEPEQEIRVRNLIDELDGIVSKDGVSVRIEGRNEYGIVANQRGYLRLGIEFLRAGVMQPSPRSRGNLDLDLGYLIAEDSDEHLYWFERSEDVPKPPPESTHRRDPMAQYISLLFLVIVLLALIGLTTVILWIVRIWPRLGHVYPL